MHTYTDVAPRERAFKILFGRKHYPSSFRFFRDSYGEPRDNPARYGKSGRPGPDRLELGRCILLSSRCILPSSLCILSSSRCILSSSRCILPSSRCILPSSRCILPSSRCILSASRCILSASRCILSASRCILSSSRCILSSSRCILSSSRCILSSSQYARSWWILKPHSLVRVDCCSLYANPPPKGLIVLDNSALGHIPF